MNQIYSVLVWSFEVLASGFYPYKDHEDVLFSPTHHPGRFALRGEPLAGGFVGCWGEMRGDWKYLKEALFLLEHYGMGQRICHRCCVRKRTLDLSMIYSNFRRDAGHRDTILSNQEFLNIYLLLPIVSVLLMLPGFTIARVYFDHMHTHDLGITQYMVPSVLSELADLRSTVFAGATRQDKCYAAYRAYSIWCKNNLVKSVSGKPFKAKTWCTAKYPCVSQLATKASGIRSMTYWLDTVTSQHTASEHDALRAAMVKGFVNADKSLRRAGRFLTRAQHDL